ncbi:hypothetical protein G9A89_002641 [Geosiphon pyriformis]|nr:hypothetical protein G9A89_002641 [Geosiphon pyriformis]
MNEYEAYPISYETIYMYSKVEHIKMMQKSHSLKKQFKLTKVKKWEQFMYFLAFATLLNVFLGLVVAIPIIENIPQLEDFLLSIPEDIFAKSPEIFLKDFPVKEEKLKSEESNSFNLLEKTQDSFEIPTTNDIQNEISLENKIIDTISQQEPIQNVEDPFDQIFEPEIQFDSPFLKSSHYIFNNIEKLPLDGYEQISLTNNPENLSSQNIFDSKEFDTKNYSNENIYAITQVPTFQKVEKSPPENSVPLKTVNQQIYKIFKELALRAKDAYCHAKMNKTIFDKIYGVGVYSRKSVLFLFSGDEMDLSEILNGDGVNMVDVSGSPGVKVNAILFKLYQEWEKKFLAKALAFIKENKPKIVQLIGYSLGGVYAQLMSVTLNKNAILRDIKLVVFTFGQPRIGNGPFSLAVDMAANVFRFTTGNDPVPRKPVEDETQKYIHSGIEIWASSPGGPAYICSLRQRKDQFIASPESSQCINKGSTENFADHFGPFLNVLFSNCDGYKNLASTGERRIKTGYQTVNFI